MESVRKEGGSTGHGNIEVVFGGEVFGFVDDTNVVVHVNRLNGHQEVLLDKREVADVTVAESLLVGVEGLDLTNNALAQALSSDGAVGARGTRANINGNALNADSNLLAGLDGVKVVGVGASSSKEKLGLGANKGDLEVVVLSSGDTIQQQTNSSQVTRGRLLSKISTKTVGLVVLPSINNHLQLSQTVAQVVGIKAEHQRVTLGGEMLGLVGDGVGRRRQALEAELAIFLALITSNDHRNEALAAEQLTVHVELTLSIPGEGVGVEGTSELDWAFREGDIVLVDQQAPFILGEDTIIVPIGINAVDISHESTEGTSDAELPGARSTPSFVMDGTLVVALGGVLGDEHAVGGHILADFHLVITGRDGGCEEESNIDNGERHNREFHGYKNLLKSGGRATKEKKERVKTRRKNRIP